LVLANKKLVVYASFFALAGGLFNLIRNLPSYFAYIEFYNPFWSGFSFSSLFNGGRWLSVFSSSLRESLSLSGFVSDIAYLSSANLISVGVLAAALFFSSALKEFFHRNDFAWQAAFYSFAASLIFLPFYLVFSKFLPVVFLAWLFLLGESLALSLFFVILLTFFEIVFLRVIIWRSSGFEYRRQEVFASVSGSFRSLFLFNLIWVFLNPVNFPGLISVPALLSRLSGSLSISWLAVSADVLRYSSIWLFLMFSLAFVFTPVLMVLRPSLGLWPAMKGSLDIYRRRSAVAAGLIVGGVLLQSSADFLVGFFSRVVEFFGFGQFFQVFFKDIVGPVFYASALLIFISAIARLADDFGKGTAAKPAENAVGDSKGLNLE